MKPADQILNILTVVVLGLTVVSCLCIGSIFVNPLGVFNFLGPATFPAPLSVPTLGGPGGLGGSPTPLVFPTFPPEWTATITPTPTDAKPTNTPAATDTSEPEATSDGTPTRTPFPTAVGPTETRTPQDPPTRTATVPPPTRTVTPGPYPGQIPTATRIPPTAYP